MSIDAEGGTVSAVADLSRASQTVRLIVVGDDREILDDIGNALWIWPHKVTMATDVRSAETLASRNPPTAFVAITDRNTTIDARAIAALREACETVPILAVIPEMGSASADAVLDAGADALVLRDDIRYPTLFELIDANRRRPQGGGDTRKLLSPALDYTYRRSRIFGALVCDSSGTIVDCNEGLARQLGYRERADLLGSSLPNDLMAERTKWRAIRRAANSNGRVWRGTVRVSGSSGRTLTMDGEISADPRFPSHLQVIFVARENPAARKPCGA